MKLLHLFLCFAVGMLCAAGAEELTITDAGKSTYVIVVPQKSTHLNNRTATLLKLQLKAATGADITIIDEDHVRGRKAIFVGPVEAAKKTGRTPEKAPLVFFHGDNIYLGANPAADPQRAASMFLRDFCGIAWNPRPQMGKPVIPTLKVKTNGSAAPRRPIAVPRPTLPSRIDPGITRKEGSLVLFENGSPRFVIVVPCPTSAAANQAASELASHLNAATGSRFTIVDEDHVHGRKAIFVAHTRASGEVFKDPAFAGTAKNTMGIAFRNGNIYLGGNPQAGLLNCIYFFLENYCDIPRGIHRRKAVEKLHEVIVNPPVSASSDALPISMNGCSDYIIVLPDNATPTLQNAAAELALHIKAIAGVDLPIVGEKDYRGKTAFFIGPVKASAAVFPDFRFAGAKQDTTAIAFRNGNIYLSGKPNSGPLYAVYTFLEDYCGVRWWAAGEARIPKQPVFRVIPKDSTYAPVLISRGAFYRPALGIQAARNKANDFFSYVPSGFGDRMTVIGKVHTFAQFMPPDKYFDAHPEYFPLIGGKRKKGSNYQLCLTNEEMTREFIRICLRKIEENPGMPIISVSQNDSDLSVPCECDKCRAVIAEDNESGLFLRFVNKVAAGIKEKYPDILVQTLAYHETLVPPKKTRPMENVIILCCPIGADYAQSLEHGANNVKSRSCLTGWSRMAPRLFVWNYTANFKNYLYPHPNYRNLAGDLRFFIKNNAVGIFEQGDSGCSIGDFVRPRGWILQKLLWNPGLDEKKLCTEFFTGYYGAAGPGLLKYLDFLCDTIEKSGAFLPTVYADPGFWLSFEDIVKARRIYEDAEKKVAGQQPFAARVRRERLSLDYAYLNSVAAKVKRDRLNGIPDGINRTEVMALADEYIVECKKWNILQFREHVPFAGHDIQLRDKLAAAFNIPIGKLEQIAPAIKNPKTCWDYLAPAFFIHTRAGNWCFYEDDKAALAGKTVRMPNRHNQWAFQGLLGDAYAKKCRKWKFLVELRCDAKIPSPNMAMAFGIYDQQKRKELYLRMVTIDECRGDKYVFIETPPIELGEDPMFWCAPERLRKGGEAFNVYISSVLMYSQQE